MEIFISVIIFCAAIYFIIKNFKKKASGGGCDCGGCSSHCSQYKSSK